ncbi:class III lanthionine synthetase LanKC [Streptomyces griseoviridis]
MRTPYVFTVADPDFYEPLDAAASHGGELRPSTVPPGWHGTPSGIWTMWRRDGLETVPAGWKVHVSARPGRLGHVLDVVAAVCCEQDVSFKHLSTRLFYGWTHQKHASRPQSGKFCAAYPPDPDAARRLMERLDEALADEEGPYILSDRRFGTSRTVHYRYGSFLRRQRLRADGTPVLLVPDGRGRLVEDVRGVSFRLPDGVEDPFTAAAETPSGQADFGGYVFEAALRHSNGGGAYRGRHKATGRKVFIKEARAHTGIGAGGANAQQRLRAEWETLQALHTAAPGLAPEPLAYFSEWEHDFLVTEFVEGDSLSSWTVLHNPLIRRDAGAADFADYYGRCERVLARTEEAMDRLHAAGYLFVDVSPGNLLVAEDDTVRLIDFESAHRIGTPFVASGTPGFSPPTALVGDDPAVHDAFGLSALALLTLCPLHQVVERAPAALTYVRHDLRRRGIDIPPSLWRRATAFHHAELLDDGRAPGGDPLAPPAPERVAEAPEESLLWLRERVAEGLTAMAEADHPRRVFPTVPEGHLSNTLCLAYGTAGVVHALRRAGTPLPDSVLGRLRTDALGAVDSLGPGLWTGLAGIARVLADCGHTQEAVDLLAAADRHPLTRSDATLAGGGAGVALTHLALYGHTGDARHLERAAELAAGLADGPRALTPRLGPDDATGLWHGRTGVALMFQQLAAVTGDKDYLDTGLPLLHAELDRESDPSAVQMSFPVSTTDVRRMPYLYCGSAGVLHTVTRYLRERDDERLAAASPRLLTALTTSYTGMSGLGQGLSGLALVLSEHAALTGSASSRRLAVDAACGLFAHAVPHPTGVRFLGDQMLRLSAELWSGSAGVLLALTEVLSPAPDPLFTVDAVAASRA